ncbi:E3 ubiquitin-protein ligase BRE1B-like isoform X1 [Sorex araneus]|uniref:E3 ubiquitin-protein ligase BRE1B-like isoform X1 n=1 Tax=Sorex araneus TaxID=42254 RepID=UPI0024336F25|nr:E3 ubiquitin-protein ligase BRE1B-like isoform X1 [Sorex araneus]
MSEPSKKLTAKDGVSGHPEKLSSEEMTTPTLRQPIYLGGISSIEELDLKVLQFKNQKLAECLEHRKTSEDELRERIEKLEKRQAADDAMLLTVNRYWAQLDETVETLLRCYENQEVPGKQEGPTPPLTEPGTSELRAPLPVQLRPRISESALAFVVALGTSSKEEVELQQQGRVEFSKAAVSLLVKISDFLQLQVGELCARVYSKEDKEFLGERSQTRTSDLGSENQRLQDLVTQLHEKYHRISLEYFELQDKVTSSETKVRELETTVEDLQWDTKKLHKREQKLNKKLAEALNQLDPRYNVSGTSSGFNFLKFETLKAELKENQELATNCLAELEKLQAEFHGAVVTKERLNVALLTLPMEMVRETDEYQMLQAQFSFLYNEYLQVKTQLDESRELLLSTNNSHQLYIQHMENNEVGVQINLRTEVFHLEDTVARVRKEYETLRLEFEQNQAANEQAEPINREMRQLTISLQIHNNQLKKDVHRYKRKLRDIQAEINKHQARASGSAHSISGVIPTGDSSLSTSAPGKEEGGPGPVGATDNRKKLEAMPATATATSSVKKEELPPAEKDLQPVTPVPQGLSSQPQKTQAGPSRDFRGQERPSLGVQPKARAHSRAEREKAKVKETKRKTSEHLKGLRAELKKAHESQKEMKLLLDMYKLAPKEQRDNQQLMEDERKVKAEVDQLQGHVQEMEEKYRRESKKRAYERALRSNWQAQQIKYLRRKLGATKREEDALASEMEVTGQAFEELQEQNQRLKQQLQEKDEANFKLLSERGETNDIYKLLCEEKSELEEQVLSLQSQVNAQLLTVQTMEHNEWILQGCLGSVERELMLCNQALEQTKTKALETMMLVENLKAHLEQVQTQLQQIQPCLEESRVSREKESFNLKRAQEDISRLEHKLEKKRKVYAEADEIHQEEIKEYKTWLTCPCCNTRKKDAVLTKCFHVFCFKCVWDRYEARQRKCPKCNTAFGAHDFHRIYIS